MWKRLYTCECGRLLVSAEEVNACHAANHWLPPKRERGPESGDIGELQRAIAWWADSVFPDRTAHDACVKLMLEEIPEWRASGMADPSEFADIVILVLDIAYLQGIDIKQAVLEKMRINGERRWVLDPKTRIISHVREPK